MTINYRILKDRRDCKHKMIINDYFVWQLDIFTKVIFKQGAVWCKKKKYVHKYTGHVTYSEKGRPGMCADKVTWLIIQEPGGIFVYKPKLLKECSFGNEEVWYRGDKAYDVTGWSDIDILKYCTSGKWDSHDYRDDYLIEKRTMRYISKTDTGICWCVEYDGKSIFDIMEDYPKMPVGQIKMVVINEGGIIEADGTIRRGNR